MKVANCSQMKDIDSTAINDFGIPGVVLMENAALGVVEEAVKTLGDLSFKSIVIFCGKGNNGGDGFAIARHLYNKGANVIVILLDSKEKVKGDALINLDIIEKLDIKIVEAKDESYLEGIAATLYLCDLVIDAIFGTGIKGKIKGIAKDIIKIINSSGSYTISVDIPSGVNGDTGQICDVCVKADKTVTFALPKVGLLSYPGADYVGELIVADISIPNTVVESKNISVNIIEPDYIKSIIPVRESQTNKGDYGKLFIIAGSVGMTGAAVLTSQSALRTGSGLVTVGIPQSLNNIIEAKLTEVMSYPLKDEGGILSLECMDSLLSKINSSDVIAFGPGLSNTNSIEKILLELIKKCKKTIVIDADGINVLAKNINVLKENECNIILTPHPGEMSRLTGLDIEYIQNNRIKTTIQFAKEYNTTILLKGAKTVIANPEGEVYINTTGNPGMATGGMGDVLTGIIASLCGQGLDNFQAAVSGAFIHGYAGDIASEEKGMHGLTAVDTIDNIPKVLKILGGV